MSPSIQAAVLCVIYTIIISGSFYYSGTSTEKTLYDRHIVSLDTVYVPSSDPVRTQDFYTNVLNFKPFKQDLTLGILLPEQKKIIFEKTDLGRETAGPILKIKVKNGFQKLHKKLLDRPDLEASDTGAETESVVSPITNGLNSRHFTVADPDLNQIVFYETSLIQF